MALLHEKKMTIILKTKEGTTAEPEKAHSTGKFVIVTEFGDRPCVASFSL